MHSSESVFKPVESKVDPVLYYNDCDIDNVSTMINYGNKLASYKYSEASALLNNSKADFVGAWLLNLFWDQLQKTGNYIQKSVKDTNPITNTNPNIRVDDAGKIIADSGLKRDDGSNIYYSFDSDDVVLWTASEGLDWTEVFYTNNNGKFVIDPQKDAAYVKSDNTYYYLESDGTIYYKDSKWRKYYKDSQSGAVFYLDDDNETKILFDSADNKYYYGVTPPQYKFGRTTYYLDTTYHVYYLVDSDNKKYNVDSDGQKYYYNDDFSIYYLSSDGNKWTKSGNRFMRTLEDGTIEYRDTLNGTNYYYDDFNNRYSLDSDGVTRIALDVSGVVDTTYYLNYTTEGEPYFYIILDEELWTYDPTTKKYKNGDIETDDPTQVHLSI